MSAATVVNIKLGQDYDVYVGRAGQGQSGTFGNPYKSWTLGGGHEGTREAIRRFGHLFKAQLEGDEVFAAQVEALRGKRLGCFCRPAEGFRGQLLCHAQVIAGYLNGCAPQEIP